MNLLIRVVLIHILTSVICEGKPYLDYLTVYFCLYGISMLTDNLIKFKTED